MIFENENAFRLQDQRAHMLTDTQEEPRAFDLRELLAKFKRQRFIILAAIVIGVAAMWLSITFYMTPMYRGEVEVSISTREKQPVEVEAVMTGLPRDLEALAGEIEIIKSRSLAEKVIRKLNLNNIPEFNLTLQGNSEPGALDKIDLFFEDLFSQILPERGSNEDAIAKDFGDPEEQIWTSVVDKFLSNLGVRPIGRSFIIEISYSSEDPSRAALIANTIADLYMVDQLDAKYEATEKASNWLKDRLVTLRSRTEEAERAVEQFRKESGLTRGEHTTLAAQEISQLSTELSQTQIRRAQAEARLREAERALKANGPTLLNEELRSPLIQSLTEKRIELQRRLALAMEEFGERHPTIVSLRAELSDLNQNIRREIEKIMIGLRNDVAIAAASEASLTQTLEQQKHLAGELAQSEVRLRSLMADAEANRALLGSLQQRFNEMVLQRDMQQPDARIISAATIPQFPSEPNKRLLIGLALFGSAIIGLSLAFIREHLDHGFRSLEQLSAITRTPGLGLIPSIPVWLPRRHKRNNYFLEKPNSMFAEAINSIAASLFLLTPRPMKTFLVTSVLPGEGKSLFSVNLARALAGSGMNVLLIDADLRRPTLHRILQLPQKPGLVEVLSDQTSLEEAIQKDPRTGVNLLAGVSIVGNPLNYLAANKMSALLNACSNVYDIVIIDGPPFLVVSDARLITGYVDGTIFLVRWARTSREQVRQAVKQIINLGGSVSGAVLSQVHIRAHSKYISGELGRVLRRKEYFSD